MKTVCVSTYCEWGSYGSIMQTMGLKKQLSDLGFNSFVVRDKPAPEKRLLFKWNTRFGLKGICRDILNLPNRRKMRRYYAATLQYMRQHVDIVYYPDAAALKNQPPHADYYLVGSDQVWHPVLCNPSFFLDFVPSHHRRISYAVSMNLSYVPEKNKERFHSYVSKFDEISVREEEMIDVISPFTEKDIHTHIDPSFFLNADEWRARSHPYPMKKPYILVYALYWDKKLNAELKELKRTSGCEIVSLCPNGISPVWADRLICDADPGQFLYLIDHAEAVVTSSFHGVALSLNFNKKLAAILNPATPVRIHNILNVLNVPQVGIADVMNFNLGDYARINERIKEERTRGAEYLKKVLF